MDSHRFQAWLQEFETELNGRTMSEWDERMHSPVHAMAERVVCEWQGPALDQVQALQRLADLIHSMVRVATEYRQELGQSLSGLHKGRQSVARYQSNRSV